MKKIFTKNIFKKRLFPVGLVAVILLTLVLRMWKLDGNSFVADEFIDLNASYGYFKTGQWHAWDFNLETPDEKDFYPARDERSWIYRWQVARLFSFFPLNEFSARLVSVFWGVITVLVIYWSAWIFTRKKTVALLSAFLFAVSVTGIEYDRKLRMYAMFYPIFLMFSTCLFLFLETFYEWKGKLIKKSANFFGVNWLYLIPTILAGLLSLHLQLLTVNIVFSLLVYWTTILFFSYFFQSFPISRSARWGMSAFGFSLLVIIFFFPEILRELGGTAQFFMDNYGYFGKITRDFQHPLLGVLAVAAGYWALFSYWKKPKEALWLGSNLLVPFLLTVFIWKRTQGVQYIFYLQSFLIILAAAGVVGAGEWLAKNLSIFSAQKIIWVFILVGAIILPNYGYFFSGDTTYDRDNDSVADYRKVFSYLKKNRKHQEALITRNFRNYYYRGWQASVLDFGGERADHDLKMEEIRFFVCDYPAGWVVIFDNDWNYIKKEARRFVEANLEKVDHSSIRGVAEVYHWDETNQRKICQ